jgi:hypothetical protein
MNITICGSIAFYDQMVDTQKALRALGYDVRIPPHQRKDGQGKTISVSAYYDIRKKANKDDAWVWERKEEGILEHFEKVAWCDAILVLNHEKNGIVGYVGANTLMEMGLALYFQKKIYMLHSIPDMAYTEEICGMHPVILGGDLSAIK